jgi:hypothetical protein
MVRPLGALGLVILVLQGCAELGLDGWFAAPAGPEPPVPARKPGIASPQEGGEAATTAQQAKAAPTAGDKADEPPVDKADEPAVDKADEPAVEQLVGLDFAGVRTLLGAPALEEIQPPATVWAYNGRGCVLSIFFYPHVDGGSFRALTYDVKGAEQTEDLPQRCFAELLQDGNTGGTN